MTHVLKITRGLGLTAGVLAAVAFAGCGGTTDPGQSGAELRDGTRDGMEERPSDDGTMHEDPGDPCAGILERLNEETDPFVIEQIFAEYDACIGGGGDHGCVPEDPCAYILERLEYATTQCEIDQIFAEYDACVGGPEPEDPCSWILEALQYETEPAIIEELIRQYEACVGPPPEMPEDPCAPILDAAVSESDPEIAAELYQRYDECVAGAGEQGDRPPGE